MSPFLHRIVGGVPQPDPKLTNAYLVGGGIASLSAAVFLIRDAHVPASQIHILESSAVPGGSMDGAGHPNTGYVLRGGRMLNFSYVCLYDLLASIPSLTDEKVSVMEEIKNFNKVKGNKTHANARLVTREKEYPGMRMGIADATDFELSEKDKEELLKMVVESEKSLGSKEIRQFFSEEFFQSNFWLMFATMFAFQPWHSAVEFRRYMHRFIQEIPRIDTLAGVDRTPYNQYDSIIRPLMAYLQKQGVQFQYNTKVDSLSYTNSEHTTVEEIHIGEAGATGIIHVHEHDIVLITLGSMTSDSSIGMNSICPAPLPVTKESPSTTDGSWALWESLSHDSPLFGHPSNFSTRPAESHWESFTVTMKTPDFAAHLTSFTHNASGTGALVTLKDSNWLLSLVMPHQPHFLDQPADITVFWGYGLRPAAVGNFVQKPMIECSGEEILSELLGHLRFPLQPTVENAITIPCSMPYITSQFLTRSPGDRPQVIPHGSTNLAFMGQYVEMPLDVVFTVEYSVRGAQEAVYGLMGVWASQKTAKKVYRGDHDPVVLARALKVILQDGTRWSERGRKTNDLPELISFR